MKLHDLTDLSEGTKAILDLASVSTLLATLFSILPAFATVFTVLWTLFRLLETKVAQTLIYRTTGFDLGRWLDHRGQSNEPT